MKKKRDADRVAMELLGASPDPPVSKIHQFKHKKPVPLPKSPETAKPITRAHVVLQKKKEVSFEQKHCIPNQKYPLIYLEALKQKHIANDGVKERWIATRNLKLISLQMQQWIYSKLDHQIHHSENQEDPTFHQLIEKREERHFQIDRIIKYLSNC